MVIGCQVSAVGVSHSADSGFASELAEDEPRLPFSSPMATLCGQGASEHSAAYAQHREDRYQGDATGLKTSSARQARIDASGGFAVQCRRTNASRLSLRTTNASTLVSTPLVASQHGLKPSLVRRHEAHYPHCTMTSIYLVRHGKYEDGQVGGQGPNVDLGLTDEGRTQVAALARRLATAASSKADALYSSPLPRALQTAELIAPSLRLAVKVNSDLEEWRSDDGNVNQDEFMATWRSLSDKDRLFHRFVVGFETAIEFSTRVQSALYQIIKQHDGQSVLLVVHGGVIQVAFQYFFGYGDAAFRRAYSPLGRHRWRVPAGRDLRALARVAGA